MTVTVAEPTLPSLVAVMVAEPAALPVTSPLVLTVAIVVLLLDQVMGRPGNGLPFPSAAVAVSRTVCPACTEAEDGLTLTVATGMAVTVTAAVPFWPSLVAVIVAVPATTPVTSPLPSTAATALLLLDHVTVRPDNGYPSASSGVAVSCTPAPISTLTSAGLTRTDATGA